MQRGFFYFELSPAMHLFKTQRLLDLMQYQLTVFPNLTAAAIQRTCGLTKMNVVAL